MFTELVADFIVVIPTGIVLENPACVFSAARLVHEATDFVVLARPKSPNPAERQIADRPEKTMMIVKCGEKRDWPLMAINVRAGMQVNSAEAGDSGKECAGATGI